MTIVSTLVCAIRGERPDADIATALATREAAEIAEARSTVVEEILKSSEQPRDRQPAQSTTYASTPSR